MVGTSDDIEALKAALAAERAARLATEARGSSTNALIASLKLQIEMLRRKLYGQRSERTARFEHLSRERVMIPGPTSCDCCGSTKPAKLGEDVTETLEVIPRQWKVTQHVREKFACRPKVGFWGERASPSRRRRSM